MKTTKEILKEFKHHFYIDNLKKKYTVDEYKDMEIILQTNWSKSDVKWVKVEDVENKLIDDLIRLKNNGELNMSEQKGIYLAIISIKLLIKELK